MSDKRSSAITTCSSRISTASAESTANHSRHLFPGVSVTRGQCAMRREKKEEVGRRGREMGDWMSTVRVGNRLCRPPALSGQKKLMIKNARALWQAELFHSRQVAVAARILSSTDELTDTVRTCCAATSHVGNLILGRLAILMFLNDRLLINPFLVCNCCVFFFHFSFSFMCYASVIVSSVV